MKRFIPTLFSLCAASAFAANVGHLAAVSNVSFTQDSQQDVIVTYDLANNGQPAFVTADMVKPGAVVIDVGTTRVPDSSRKSGYRLTGDVKFDEVAPLCSFITPVPGGVGPMTICSLMKNTLLAAKRSNQ